MKVPIAVSLLACCVLGAMTAPAVAQTTGPHCVEIVEFGEVAEFFGLGTGKGQLIATGKSITFGDAYTGASYIEGNVIVFTLAIGLVPAVLEGQINLSNGQGHGSIIFLDTSEGQALTYRLFSPPCVLN
jgi:hypothetical protein